MKEELKKIFEFPILYAGWELDSKGWVVENKKGERFILLTNHEMEETAKKKHIVFLKKKIKEYESAIGKTQLALTFL